MPEARPTPPEIVDYALRLGGRVPWVIVHGLTESAARELIAYVTAHGIEVAGPNRSGGAWSVSVRGT